MRFSKDFPAYPCMGNHIGFICAMGSGPYRIQNSSAQLLCRSKLQHYFSDFIHLRSRPVDRLNLKKPYCLLSDWMPSVIQKKKWLFSSLFSMLLGAALQITNTYGDAFWAVSPKSLNCRLFRSETFSHPVIHFTDVRNTVYSGHSFLPASFRNQTCHANQYVCLGVPIRTVWVLGRSGIRTSGC